MEYIAHPISKKIVKAHNFMMFDDWKEVNFIELECEKEEELTDNEAVLIGTIKSTGQKFEAKMSISDYFEGKFFILTLKEEIKENDLETEQPSKTTIFENKEVIIYKYNNVYRVHFYKDENNNIKAENMSSFITKDYNKLIARLKSMNINIEENENIDTKEVVKNKIVNTLKAQGIEILKADILDKIYDLFIENNEIDIEFLGVDIEEFINDDPVFLNFYEENKQDFKESIFNNISMSDLNYINTFSKYL